MGCKRVRVRSAKSARKKASGKSTVVSKVNYIPGSKKGSMKSYQVYTHKKKNK